MKDALLKAPESIQSGRQQHMPGQARAPVQRAQTQVEPSH